MKNIRVFLSDFFQFLEVKFSIYLNRRVFVMIAPDKALFFSTKKCRHLSYFSMKTCVLVLIRSASLRHF